MEMESELFPDVTIGLSDHYIWDASSVVVDAAEHRRASVQAAYNEKLPGIFTHGGIWRIPWIGSRINGQAVPYPYPKTTIFQGFADMEYPMMVNDASNRICFFQICADHEIAHTYFPFYMGINESQICIYG